MARSVTHPNSELLLAWYQAKNLELARLRGREEQEWLLRMQRKIFGRLGGTPVKGMSHSDRIKFLKGQTRRIKKSLRSAERHDSIPAWWR